MIYKYYKKNDYLDFLEESYKKEHEIKSKNQTRANQIFTICTISITFFTFILANFKNLINDNLSLSSFLIYVLILGFIWKLSNVIGFLGKFYTDYPSHHIPTPDKIEEDFKKIKLYAYESNEKNQNKEEIITEMTREFFENYYKNAINDMSKTNEKMAEDICKYFKTAITLIMTQVFIGLIIIIIIYASNYK